MNITLLSVFKEWGGAQVFTVQLARTLIQEGHNATIVCLSEHAYELYQKRSHIQIPLVCLPAHQKMNFTDWVRLFSSQTSDACILIKGTFHIGSWHLDLAARYCFSNYLTVEQLVDSNQAKPSRRHFGILPGLGLWWYRRRFEGFFRSLGPRKVICVSDAMRQRLIQDYRFPASKLITVHNTIDVQRFLPHPSYSQAWRQRWGIPNGALVFGAIGRLAPMKGYDTTLASFQALLKQFPEKDLRLVLVGEGPEEQHLNALASQIVPKGRVVFSPFCDRSWEPLNAMDIFIMASLNEGLPLALLEAMACGCCPVATTVGGIAEVLSKPGLGWLVPPADVDALTVAMIHAASLTPEERAAMGQRARQHIVDNFNASVQFKALVRIIESVTSKVRPRGHAERDVVPRCQS